MQIYDGFYFNENIDESIVEDIIRRESLEYYERYINFLIDRGNENTCGTS